MLLLRQVINIFDSFEVTTEQVRMVNIPVGNFETGFTSVITAKD
jgi:hypothetical protein